MTTTATARAEGHRPDLEQRLAAASPHPRAGWLPPRAARPELGDRRPHRLLGRVDPRTLGHRHPALGRRRGDRRDDGPRGRRQALANSAIDIGRIDTVIVATVSHPYQTPRSPAGRASARRGPGRRFRHLRRVRGLLPRISLAHDMVRGGTSEFVLVIGVEKPPTSRTRPTAAPPSSSPTAPAPRSSALGGGRHRADGVGSDGAQWDAIVQRDSWLDVRDRTSTGRRSP